MKGSRKGIRLAESDVRAMVRLVGAVAQEGGGAMEQKRFLMDRLARLVKADAWSWVVAQADDQNNNPIPVSFMCAGLNDKQVAALHERMHDRSSPPPEYARLNELWRTRKQFTRSWDQLVSDSQWYGPGNRRMFDDVRMEHVMYCVRVLDKRGLFSGIALRRRIGGNRFTPRQRRIAHIVLSEVEWLHRDGEDRMAKMTQQVKPLAPKVRTVLGLLVGKMSVQEIADRLKLSYFTVNDYCKKIYRHFDVHSRRELIGRFITGDGQDVE